MKAIAVGGQMLKPQICEYIKKFGNGEYSPISESDFQAALLVKNGQADYYFGCCATGAGGSLAGAIAILGYSNCASISLPGKVPVREEITQKLKEGKKAFGFTDGSAENAVRMLIEEIDKLGK